VEGACGGEADFEFDARVAAEAPSTTLLRKVMPLPGWAAEEERGAARTIFLWPKTQLA